MQTRSLCLRLAAMPLTVLSMALKAWPFLLLAWLFIGDSSPHLRWSYSYTQIGDTRIYNQCFYLGIHGQQAYDKPGNCPLITILRKEGA